MSYNVKDLSKQLKKYGITDEKIIKESEKKLSEIISTINVKELDNEVLWDKAVDKYYKSTERLTKLLKNENIKDSVSNKMIENLNTFLKICEKPEFHIAFVGAIKAGKSTIINALLGKNLASTSVTPETAALTKFRASKNTNYINLTFYNNEEWKQLWDSVQESKSETFLQEYNNLEAENEKDKWLNKANKKIEFEDIGKLKKEIEKWTSSKQPTHYFVKEVEVGLKDFNMPEGVIFVDTPGLDDPVKYRSDITREYIDRANAVFVCVKSDALTGQELRTIYSVFSNSRYNPEKVYIIGTQLDSLNRPIDNWHDQRIEWLKHLSKSDCYRNKKLAEKNLFITAAYLYNLCIDFDNLTEDEIYYELEPAARKFRVRKFEENIDKLIDFSEIEKLKAKLEKDIIEKYKTLLVKDIKTTYQSNKEDLESLFKNIKNTQLELLDLTNADIEEVKVKKQESERDLNQNKKEQNEIQRTLKQIKIMTNERAQELYKEINEIGGNINV